MSQELSQFIGILEVKKKAILEWHLGNLHQSKHRVIITIAVAFGFLLGEERKESSSNYMNVWFSLSQWNAFHEKKKRIDTNLQLLLQ